MAEYLIEHNHLEHDVYNKYTIDQIWLYYSKSVIIRRKQQYEDALVFAHCMTLPLGGKEAAQAFNKFLRGLLPEEFKKATHAADRQRMVSDARPDLALQKAGIPIVGTPQKRKKKIGPDGKPIKPETKQRPEVPEHVRKRAERPEVPEHAKRKPKPEPPKNWRKPKKPKG